MQQSIGRKVLLAILAVTIITACSITIVYYFRAAEMIEENYTDNLYGRVRQTVTSLDDSLLEIYDTNIKTANNEKLIAYIQEYKTSESREILDETAEFLRSKKGGRDLSSLYLVLPEEKMVITSEDYPVCKREISQADLMKIQEAEMKSSRPVMLEDLVHENGKKLTCIQPVIGNNGENLGYLLANTEERNLFYEYLEPVSDDKISNALILDENYRIVSNEEYKKVGEVYQSETLPEQDGIFNEKKENKIRILYKGSFSGCRLYLEIPRGEVLRELRQMQFFLVGIFSLFLLVAVVLAGEVTKMIYRPIKKLTDTVEKVSEGDLSLRAEVETEDEIGTLCQEFNIMLDDIQDLIGRVIEEERQKKDAELEALQYQITPHFMYNTLNSIKYAALIKGEKELGGLIGDFVELLQASINKKGTFITVADELHILKNYIHLQEFRYQGSFAVFYDVQQETFGCYIPTLILQPLVENALLHGIDMKGKEGQLIIRGRVEGERLILSIIDNGRGMTQEQIDTLLHSKAKKTNGLSAIGVPNVRERLELYYEEKGGLIYESSEQGTTASIFLPVQREQE